MEYIIAIILLMLLFSLPDALRRKRRYPHRGKRRSSPIDTPQRQKQTRPEPSPQRASQTGQAPEQGKMHTAGQGTRNPAPADTGRLEGNHRPAAATIGTTAEPVTVPGAPAVVYSYVQPPAWSGLSGEARDIYAGLVWSELLQKPVSLRDRK